VDRPYKAAKVKMPIIKAYILNIGLQYLFKIVKALAISTLPLGCLMTG